MKLLVTRIFFDLPDEDVNQFGSIIGAKEYKQQLQFELQTTAKSIWEVDCKEQLIPKIERTLGHKISTIEYQSNLLHSLTSYM